MEGTDTSASADRFVEPPIGDVRDAVRRALAEDLTPLGDLTAVLLPAEARCEARFVSRKRGVVAGTSAAQEAFVQVDPSVEVAWQLRDGGEVEPGSVIGTVSGPLASVLTAERTALNFLGHLSGIATLTSRFAAAAPGVQIWDTRKTIPGLRSLAKAAVRAGGGRNHRGNLSDAIMLKDNHLTGIGITEAVRAARSHWPNRIVTVECVHEDQMVEAIECGADSVLLDNMSPAQVAACVATAAEMQAGTRRRTLLEASGGINLDTVTEFAATGVDLISVGALTNSAPVLDIGLDI
jgi:nicotinate-nucleotide pyrophosphorylase (carboxylating)